MFPQLGNSVCYISLCAVVAKDGKVMLGLLKRKLLLEFVHHIYITKSGEVHMTIYHRSLPDD